MTKQEIKNILHESIENINDEDFLLALKEFLDNNYIVSTQPQLSDWQRKRIDESERQINKGEYLTNEQADKLVEKWLNE